MGRARIATLPRTSLFVSVSLAVLGLLPLPAAARLLIPRLLLRGLPGAFSVADSLSLGCCLAISRFIAGVALITALFLARRTAFRGITIPIPISIPTRTTLPLSRAALA
ncbi:MAG: hypothetical protein ACKOOF_13250 [Planctomycetaceae bacterium]